MSPGSLTELERVVAARLEAALADLRRRRAHADAIRARIAALDRTVARQRAEAAGALDMLLAGPVLDRWDAWSERRRADLNAELARAMASAELARQQAKQAFGQAEALRLLRQDAAEEARRALRRKQ